MTSVQVSSHVIPQTTTGVVICLATGPSLNAADVDYCRGKGVVIAINDAHRLAPWADVLYSNDSYWWHFHNYVPDFQGLRVGLRRHGEPAGMVLPSSVFCVEAHDDTGLDVLPNRVVTTKNSGGAAINLAVHAGAKKIVLLGYDMASTNGQRHFFGDHPRPIRRHRDALYLTFQNLIATMVEPLRALGIEVVNCSRQTALTCFPSKPLEDVL